MSAAERREVLEAALWRAVTACHVRGTPVCGCKANVAAILGLIDTYALDIAASQVAKALDDRARASRLTAAEASAAEHRERLAAATAERTGRPA